MEKMGYTWIYQFNTKNQEKFGLFQGNLQYKVGIGKAWCICFACSSSPWPHLEVKILKKLMSKRRTTQRHYTIQYFFPRPTNGSNSIRRLSGKPSKTHHEIPQTKLFERQPKTCHTILSTTTRIMHRLMISTAFQPHHPRISQLFLRTTDRSLANDQLKKEVFTVRTIAPPEAGVSAEGRVTGRKGSDGVLTQGSNYLLRRYLTF